MKKLYFFFLFVLASVNLSAQGVRMRDLFASMPDSLLPLVTKNNRLDCIDFIENNMEARVRNRLDEFVELKKLTSDYLLFQTSRQGYVEMKYVACSDTTGVIYMVRTYLGPVADSHVQCYSQDWEPMEPLVSRPRVEEFFRIPASEQTETLQYVLLALKDLTFLKASLSEDEPRLTWEISLQQLSKEDRKIARQYVTPVVKELP